MSLTDWLTDTYCWNMHAQSFQSQRPSGTRLKPHLCCYSIFAIFKDPFSCIWQESNQIGQLFGRQCSSLERVFMDLQSSSLWLSSVSENSTFGTPQSSQTETGHQFQEIMAYVKTTWFTCPGNSALMGSICHLEKLFHFYFLGLICMHASYAMS